jgi:hypothetical protein
VLALAPGAVIVNLAGNGLNGMGVALLQLGRAGQAVPFLLAALAIRAELEDLEQQHVDLAHLATAALALGNSSIAARIARFLDGHPDTAAGMYGHDRSTLRAVLDATAGADADPAASFDEARRLTAEIGAAPHPSPRGARAGRSVPTGRPAQAGRSGASGSELAGHTTGLRNAPTSGSRRLTTIALA